MSSRRRPGPIGRVLAFGTAMRDLLHYNRLWLWVPAFAGTTMMERATDMPKSHGPLRIGIGGPVGSGKTALMDLLCKAMRERYDIAAITNDIYTKWDAEFLVR